MQNEESLNLLNQKPGNVKNALVQKLSKQWPLTLKQLDHALKREFSMDVTYQAVHKAASQLEDEKVVEKTKEGYQLLQEWILNITKLSNQISQAYADNQPLDFDKEIIQLKFQNWISVGRFITFDFKENAPNLERKSTVIYWIHVWPVNTVAIEEMQRIENFALKNEHHCICSKNTPLDRTAAHYLGRMHMHSITGANILLDHDFTIIGNHIAHIYYEKSFLDKVDKFYRKTKDMHNIDLIKLQELVTAKTNITVIIVKNADLAEQLRNEALELFKKEK